MSDSYSGKIYALKSHNTDKIYIGSTFNSLSKRFSQHKYDAKKNNKKISSLEIFDFGDVYIELLNEYENISKDELKKNEGIYIMQNNCFNKCIAGRSNDEWRNENKNIIKELNAQYYENNKERIKLNVSKYRANNIELIKERNMNYYKNKKMIICECGASYKSHPERHIKTKNHLKWENSLKQFD